MHDPTLYPNSFQVNNFYVDKCLHLLDGNEVKILLYVIRKIVGWNQQFDRISLSQFENGAISQSGERIDFGLGISRSSIVRALAELKKYGILVELEHSNNPKLGTAYTLQFDYSKVDIIGLEKRLNKTSKPTVVKSILVSNLDQYKNATSINLNTVNILKNSQKSVDLLLSDLDTQNSEEKKEEKERRIRDITNFSICAPTQENLFPSQSENLSDNSTQNSTQPTSQKASSKKSSAGKKESVADPRFNHPGLVAIREIIAEAGSKEFPNKLVWDNLISVLGDNPDLAKLRKCAEAWTLKNCRIGNLTWVTEWYKDGIPLGKYPATNNQSKQEATPTLEKKEEKPRWEGFMPPPEILVTLPEYQQRFYRSKAKFFVPQEPVLPPKRTNFTNNN